MLLHCDVNYSTITAGRRRWAARKPCNAWLQCMFMRIELPSPSWADAAQRADDDAHTLTLAPATNPGWVTGAVLADAALTLRTEVTRVELEAVTLTF
jgi:hypothetical protein